MKMGLILMAGVALGLGHSTMIGATNWYPVSIKQSSTSLIIGPNVPMKLVFTSDGEIVAAGRTTDGGISFARIKTDGVQRWSFTSGGVGDTNAPIHVAVDSQTNTIVSGSFAGDYLTMKFTGTGSNLWGRVLQGGGNGVDTPTAITVDQNNNVYVTGQTFGSTGQWNATTPIHNYLITTVSYASDGTERWRRDISGANSRISHDIVADDKGYVFISGVNNTFADPRAPSEQIEVHALNANTGSSSNVYSVLNFMRSTMHSRLAVKADGQVIGCASRFYVANSSTFQFTTNRNFAWGRQVATNIGNYVEIGGLSSDVHGNVYTASAVQTFGSGPEPQSAVMQKVGNDGSLIWQRSFYSGFGAEKPKEIVVDAVGNIYVAGTTGGTLTMLKYSPEGDLKEVGKLLVQCSLQFYAIGTAVGKRSIDRGWVGS